MVSLAALVEERTDLDPADADLLTRIVADWSVVADLALSDLVLWLPVWNDGGLVAGAQVRPTTAPTAVPQDVVGQFAPRGAFPAVDQAATFGRPVLVRDIALPWLALGDEAYPVHRAGRVIAVVARTSSRRSRVAGQLEEVYLASADDLLRMIVDGRFPVAEVGDDASAPPRVGDGIVRLDSDGVVTYASPNAVSALRRLGLSQEIVGTRAVEAVTRLTRRPGPVDESVSAIVRGVVAGRAELSSPAASVMVRGLPLWREQERIGAVLFLHDVTDVRRRERALMSKDATIREIHHRVKNNLQTVAAMLRLQARRAGSDQVREALAEAQLRVEAIAVVHESLSGRGGEDVDFDEVSDRILGLVRDLAPAFADPVPRFERVGSWGQLSADVATPLTMVVSELLHNAVEHAAATSVVLRLDAEGSDLVLRVCDDGRGLPGEVATVPPGLGLSIVTSLVTGDLHGTYEFGPNTFPRNGLEPGADLGTCVTVRVPHPAVRA